MEYLNQLNEYQKRAVLQKDGPVLIIAGAGAGKTKTITHRIFHLIKEGVNPASILAVTFTNKAAKEMRERIDKMLSDSISNNYEETPFISTFHSLGVYILKENHQKLGLTKYFNIFDRNDSKKAVKEAIIASNLDIKQFEPGKMLAIISKQKNDLLTYNLFKQEPGNDYFKQIISDIWEKYEKILEKEKALDFDDLLLKTALLLKTNSDVQQKYQNQWKYIHIDEYQDTNKVQYEISKLLVNENKNICVVGDGDQNVYEWRGATIKNILNFEKDYPGTKSIILEENYRSTKTILAAANEIIKKNKIRTEKNLFTKNEDGEKISLISGYTENQEARNVAQKIKELLSNNIAPENIAVLYRANFQSRVLEEAFLEEQIPYQVLGTRFFERKEVKDILSFIKASFHPENIYDTKRIINIPPRGIGEMTLLKIFSGKQNELAPAMKQKVNDFYLLLEKIKEKALTAQPSNTIKFILQTTGLENKLKNGSDDDFETLANIMELVSLSSRYDHFIAPEGIEKFLEDTALYSDQDEMDRKKEKKEAVKLMTVHAAKGLEFDYVFVTGLEDKLFPSKRDFGGQKPTSSQQEEERRLFYVAITRAKKKLFLSYASVRTIFGSRQMNTPSEFITDISEDLILNEQLNNNSDETNRTKEKIIYLEW